MNTLTLSDNSGLAANYTLTGGTHQLTITQKAVNTSGTRNYDSTTVVGSGTLTVSGEVGSEQVTITGNGSITDKNVGSAKTTFLSVIDPLPVIVTCSLPTSPLTDQLQIQVAR